MDNNTLINLNAKNNTLKYLKFKELNLEKNNFNVFVYYNNSKLPIIYGLICGSISSYIMSYTPLIYSKIVKVLLNESSNKNANIDFLIKSFLLYKLSGTFFTGLRGYIFTKYINLISINLKNNIISHLFSKELNFFNKNNNTEIIDLIINDAKKIADLYTIFLNMSIRNIVQFIVVSYILIKKSFYLYIVCLILSSIQFIIEHFYNKFFYQKSVEDINYINIEEKNLVSDYVNKILTYRSLGLENNLKKILDKLYIKYKFLKNKEALYYGISFFISMSLNNCLQIILIYTGINLNIKYNTIYEFIIYIGEISNIIREFTIAQHDFVTNKIPLKRIKKLFNDYDNNNWGNYEYTNNENCIPGLEIKNLSFSYCKNDKKIFDNLNLIINPYSVTGINGKSGIGKSTFFKLLLGLYNQDNGEILIDNIPIKQFDRNYYYNNIIAYVGQEPELLEGTIKENILGYNFNNYDIKLYNKVLTLIKDINNLEESYKNLSGGQKQKIAICRAIMKKPKILLLDEPSSALDIQNEKNMLFIVSNIGYDYNFTIIIISHRNETLKICTNIIDFNNIIKNN